MITYILVILAAISAVAILFMKEVFHAALSLIICLLCVAGIFVTFNAEFLAVVQIIVYAGGVLLLIIFGIMLTNRTPEFVTSSHRHLVTSSHRHLVTSSLIGITLLSIFIYLPGEISATSFPPKLSPEDIGTQLVANYMIEFELAGMLLLVSLIGAIVAATNLKKS